MPEKVAKLFQPEMHQRWVSLLLFCSFTEPIETTSLATREKLVISYFDLFIFANYSISQIKGVIYCNGQENRYFLVILFYIKTIAYDLIFLLERMIFIGY